MGKFLHDGSFKPKPSSFKRAEWMAQNPTPLEVFRKGTAVKIYSGCGWQTGTVIESNRRCCTVFVKARNKNVTVFDRRNIQST
ncbi:MAG: hypothetical protein CML73_02960 [Rhodobiaceae bacterium]|nr:hypothetical protein [Rhodobiaceae bacterium]